MNDKRWVVQAPAPPEVSAALEAGGYPPLVAQLLHARGLSDPAAAQLFLDGKVRANTDPQLLQGVPAAVDRLQRAIRTGEAIVVYGDYDTDGVTATVLLTQVLQALEARVVPYIPHREEEGYGLNAEALRKVRADFQAAVVVTVDCGVRGLAEAEAARSLDIDLIITDHHEPEAELPDAFAIINPKQPGNTYPDRDLAGVGLAYKLAVGLLQPLARPPLQARDLLDLVALGTVADLAPLKGENRRLVRDGLKVITGRARSPLRPGLDALLRVAGRQAHQVDASAIGFMLGPRLNAAGRLESALATYTLLSTRDAGEALALAQQLDAQNRERQELTRQIYEQARAQIAADHREHALLFAAHPEFRQGVVGLAASRLTDEFYRPAVVAWQGPEVAKGSARSIPEFHITEALDGCRDLLVKHGGHAAAAGFTARVENLDALAECLEGHAERLLGGQDLRPTLKIDVDGVPLGALPELSRWLVQFEPCGYGNRTPVFVSRGLRVLNKKAVGKDGKHLKLQVSQGLARFGAIGFGQGELCGSLPEYVDAAYCVELGEWQGQPRLELNLRSVRPAA